ncbi:MAG: glycosyltransferase family 1 protein [Ferruginibacter sp.]
MECFKRIAAQHPEHTFIFISDETLAAELVSINNVVAFKITSKPKTALLWQFWYNYKLPSILKKNRIDLLINADGICPLRIKVPQIAIAYDLSFLQKSSSTKKKLKRFYKRPFTKSLDKAANIITASSFAKKELVNNFSIDEKKINSVPTGINNLYQPTKETDLTKQKYTEGKEFFLYKGSADNINFTNLLKAFSLFKRRQKSNMQLLIAANLESNAAFLESLKTYKYRNEICLIMNAENTELASITAASYAFVYPVLFENSCENVLQAMRCNVPVIVADIEPFHELCGDNVLYVSSNSFQDVAEKMMLLFKDENKRNTLIEKGKQQSIKYNWNKTANQLWNVITETAEL